MVASAQAIQQLQTTAATAPAAPRAAGVVGTVLECAKLAAEIAWDELFDRSKVPALIDDRII